MAIARNAISIECSRSSFTPPQCWPLVIAPLERSRQNATNTTIVQPMPINSRFAPVMFASANEHGDSVPPSRGRHAAPVSANDSPPLRANTKSTAYSGSTAISARIAIAKPAEMSSCATSAAHDSRNAAPTIAMPYSRASSGCDSSGLEARSTTAGTPSSTAIAMETLARLG